jgi:hypothetical protein
MSDKPEVGFQFGVEGDQSLLSTIQALRNELKNVQQQQQATASSAEVLSRAWSGLIQLAATVKIAEFGRDVFDTAVNLGKLSQITGVSSQTLSIYYKAATDVGVAHEAVDKGIAKLSRSFVQLQQGNSGAAAGFRLLGLSAKDFIGLNPDEKLRKVTDAFATMKDGPEKAAAAIALFGKAGAQLIPVLDQMGGEEFAKIRDQAERLGLVFDQSMVEGALRAKAALADLKGVAEGATAQFETGLVPALADTADAMTHAITGTSGISNGFKTLGEMAGKALKFIAETFILLGLDAGTTAAQIVEIFGFAWDEVKLGATSVFEAFKRAATGDFSGALSSLKTGLRDAGNEYEDFERRVHAMRENERAEAKKAHDELFNNTNPRPLPKPTGQPGDVSGAELKRGGIDRAEAAGLKQQAQDEFTLYRDLAKQKQEQDKRDYDQGLISLEEYFNRRRDAINAEFEQEIKARSGERAGLEDLLSKAEGRSGKTPQQQLANQEAVLRLKQQIAHVDAQDHDEEVKRDTALAANENARFTAKQDHLLKELEEQKKLADLEGDRAKSAQLASQIEDLQLRKELEQLGRTKAEVDAFLAKYDSARDIRSTGAAAQQGFDAGDAALANKKSGLQEQVADYQLEPYQAERQLRAEYEKEIPILEAKVQLLREQAAAAQAAAEARGEKGPNSVAVDLTKQADQDETKLIRLRTEMTKMDTTWMSWRTEALQSIDQVSTHLTTGLNGWIQGHQRFGDAMKQMWNGIVMTGVTALEKLAAQWISHHLRMLLVKQTTNQLGVASDATAAAQKTAIESTTAKQSIFKSAKSAAAKAWDALASIPYVGPILGAIAAATTFVAVMALGSFAEGGFVGRGGVPRTVSFAGGGQMVARSMLGGGFLRGPGSTTSDSIPAMLSDQEYVVSAKGVKSIGVDTLDMINRGALKGAFLPAIRHPAPYTAHGLSHYASGGIAKTFASSGGSGATQIHQHIATHSSSIDSKDFRDHIGDHMDYIADELKSRMRNFRFP